MELWILDPYSASPRVRIFTPRSIDKTRSLTISPSWSVRGLWRLDWPCDLHDRLRDVCHSYLSRRTCTALRGSHNRTWTLERLIDVHLAMERGEYSVAWGCMEVCSVVQRVQNLFGLAYVCVLRSSVIGTSILDFDLWDCIRKTSTQRRVHQSSRTIIMLFVLETISVVIITGLKLTALGLAFKWLARY
ncbi:hypothetical protein BKA63DRAFT_232767 [Paraphoma chrysanthemicola]|nr:hypothetical protein BKA63DRAFT_232767 [Paraphoma chrysanthemicola]